MTMIDAAQIHSLFQTHYGQVPSLIVRAPGRVNLIGEHTDYNDGFVLPAAIDQSTYIAATPRSDRRVRVLAADLSESDEFAIDHIERSGLRPWSNYIRGMVRALIGAGHLINGADMVVASSVPRGAGLSSSAALEVATGYMFQLFHSLNILGEELALMAQATENQFVGVNCGIMDQFIVTLGKANHAFGNSHKGIAASDTKVVRILNRYPTRAHGFSFFYGFLHSQLTSHQPKTRIGI
ncbi:MAG: hypothetical protein EBS29_03500 [Chloroflexia bacterium]|nr:hypothetical protein [Chloroflexia bacterium]